MSDNMNVYEITQMMNNRNRIQQDMTEAMSMVQGLFQEKYVNRLHQTIQTHHNRAEKTPSREVRLMQAFKEFVPEEKKRSLDGMIEACLMMETIHSMRNELQEGQLQSMGLPVPEGTDTSIHHDGIYDVDTSCLANKKSRPIGIAGLFLMMGMMGSTARL